MNLLVVSMLVMLVFGAPDEDKVSKLDGYCDYSNVFEMWSGYLTLQDDVNATIKSHYVFITSTNDPQSDDVVLWLNGGPGCSSLLGMAQELGPCLLAQGSNKFQSTFNPYAWNKKANLLFLESPPGVGFSVNHDPDYIYNETRTADDNVLALQKWFEKFPEYTNRNFWIAGQSYNGMYIPYFASALIDANQNNRLVPGNIKFKGVLIGNGVMFTGGNWRREARNAFYAGHYYYGPEINALLSYCEYTDADLHNPICLQGERLARQVVEMVNPYATTGICYSSSSGNKNRRRFWRTPFLEQNNPMMNESNAAPCTDDSGLTTFFNLDTVKAQLHVDSDITWESCSPSIGENYHKGDESISLFDKLKQNNLKILLYSGNTDAVVSYIETEEYIRLIGWDKKSEKQNYKNDKGSLMGWKQEYDGLTLVIVNGAGHMVPEDKPHAAYVMFTDFIQS